MKLMMGTRGRCVAMSKPERPHNMVVILMRVMKTLPVNLLFDITYEASWNTKLLAMKKSIRAIDTWMVLS